jgi:uncharacterized protein HemX
MSRCLHLRFDRVALACCLLAVLSVPAPAYAYIGPGAGLTAVGTLVALVAALGLGIVGFIWYPFKKLMRRSKLKAQHKAQQKTD